MDLVDGHLLSGVDGDLEEQRGLGLVAGQDDVDGLAQLGLVAVVGGAEAGGCAGVFGVGGSGGPLRAGLFALSGGGAFFGTFVGGVVFTFGGLLVARWAERKLHHGAAAQRQCGGSEDGQQCRANGFVCDLGHGGNYKQF